MCKNTQLAEFQLQHIMQVLLWKYLDWQSRHGSSQAGDTNNS